VSFSWASTLLLYMILCAWFQIIMTTFLFSRMSGRVFETIEELLKVENSDDQEEALIGEAAVNILMEYVRTKLIGHGDLIKRLHEALIALRAKELIARFRRLKGPRTDLFVNDSFAL